jgi:hypothetical protein
VSSDSALKWFQCEFYPQRKTGRAMNFEGPEGVLGRFSRAEITLFTPWGPRYDWEVRGATIRPGDKEETLLKFLAELLKDLRCNMPDRSFQWVFLAADSYGVRINGLPSEVVDRYYASLEQTLSSLLPEARLHRWSAFHDEAEPYRQAVRSNFATEFDPSLVARATKTAQAMGRGGDATAYLEERLAEARLVDDRWSPVKISCVGRHKDHGVDGPLPVLYFVPPALHAPWMR